MQSPPTASSSASVQNHEQSYTTNTDLVMFVSTAPTLDVAQNLARTLLEEQLAACIHIFPMGMSIYRWQGAVEESAECTLLLKTTKECREVLSARFCALHPYDVPELVEIAVTGGLPAYLAWASEQVKPR